MNNFSEWIAADRSWWGKLCSFVFVHARSRSGFRIRARYIQRRISNLVFRRKPFGRSPQRARGSGKKIGTAGVETPLPLSAASSCQEHLRSIPVTHSSGRAPTTEIDIPVSRSRHRLRFYIRHGTQPDETSNDCIGRLAVLPPSGAHRAKIYPDKNIDK
jgi:hypothetical protein